jgi:hypothetical protein
MFFLEFSAVDPLARHAQFLSELLGRLGLAAAGRSHEEKCTSGLVFCAKA